MLYFTKSFNIIIILSVSYSLYNNYARKVLLIIISKNNINYIMKMIKLNKSLGLH